MSRINSALTASPPSNTLVGNSIEDLDLDVFLDLMLTELQNQDPLNPMDNQEMLNTISQIREISANDRLSETLDSVLLGQNVATATGLIGTEVEGLTADGRRVNGAVQNVAINDGEPQLELAVATKASAGESEGAIKAGSYTYEVVWETGSGPFSVRIPVNTAELGDDFNGSIQLENLPVTGGAIRKVYRSKNGGPPQLVGPLPSSASRFTDSRADGELREETAPAGRQIVEFADSVKVKLSNISTVQTRR